MGAHRPRPCRFCGEYGTGGDGEGCCGRSGIPYMRDSESKSDTATETVEPDNSIQEIRMQVTKIAGRYPDTPETFEDKQKMDFKRGADRKRIIEEDSSRYKCVKGNCGGTLKETGHEKFTESDIYNYACEKCGEPYHESFFGLHSITNRFFSPTNCKEWKERSHRKYLDDIEKRLDALKCAGTRHTTEQSPHGNGSVTYEDDIMVVDIEERMGALDDLVEFFKITQDNGAKEMLYKVWDSNHDQYMYSHDRKKAGRALGISGFKLWWGSLF